MSFFNCSTICCNIEEVDHFPPFGYFSECQSNIKKGIPDSLYVHRNDILLYKMSASRKDICFVFFNIWTKKTIFRNGNRGLFNKKNKLKYISIKKLCSFHSCIYKLYNVYLLSICIDRYTYLFVFFCESRILTKWQSQSTSELTSVISLPLCFQEWSIIKVMEQKILTYVSGGHHSDFNFNKALQMTDTISHE